LRGQSVTLPIGEALASLTVGPIVQASLRTKDPREAKVRHAIADGVLKRFWHAHQAGMVTQSLNDPFGAVGRTDQAPIADTAKSEPRHLLSPGQSPTGKGGSPLTVGDLFDRWAAYNADKRSRNTIKRYRGSFRSLIRFFEGRDVRTLTTDDLFLWAEFRRDREGISVRAINRNDLATVCSVFRWASGRSGGSLMTSNTASGVSLDRPKIVAGRERTFRDNEARAILAAASAVCLDPTNLPRSATRRWCPWLAAYSGARIGELTSLERRDIRDEGGIPVMDLRVTKTGQPRTVPLHSHLIEQGFLAFVASHPEGPLFYDPKRHGKGTATTPSELQGHKLGRWIREKVSLDKGVHPNHGWRHTWKTRALEAGIEERLRDAVTGHSVASVGRRYETPTLKMLADAMSRFPRYHTGP
jgi:integrase